MSRFYVYKGKKISKPGAFPTVRTTRPRRGTAGFRGTLLLVGESDEGPQGYGEFINPNDVVPALGAGPLADAALKAFSPSNDEAFAGSPGKVAYYQTNNSTPATATPFGDQVVKTGAVQALSTRTSVIMAAASVTLNQLADHTLEIVFTAERKERCRVVSNTATSGGNVTLEVEGGYTAAPAAALTANVLEPCVHLTAKRNGVRMNDLVWTFEEQAESGTTPKRYRYSLAHPAFPEPEISPFMLNNPVVRVRYAGGPVLANSEGPLATGGTVAIIKIDVGAAPVLNAFSGKVLQIDLPSGTIQRAINGNTALDPVDVTIESGQEITAAQLAEIEALITAATPPQARVRDASATVTIEGANGVATQLVGSVLPTADPLTVNFAAQSITTLRDLTRYIQQTNPNYVCTVPAGINQDTTLVADFDYGVASPMAGANAAIDCRFDDAISPTTQGRFTQNVAQLVAYINAVSGFVTASRPTGATSGRELPQVTTDALKFFRGARGVSTDDDFQDAFTDLLKRDGQHVVVLISDDMAALGQGSTATFRAVLQQLRDHLVTSNESNRRARGGYVGTMASREALIQFSREANYQQVQLVPQEVECLGANGKLGFKPAWMYATICAACRAVGEIGEPLTAKKLAVTGLRNHSSWDASDPADVNALTEAGIMCAEETSRGFFIVRDITTYLDDDDDDIKIDGNMVEESRFLADDLPAFLESRFKGKKLKNGAREGRVPSVASVRQAVIERSLQYKDAPFFVISPSKDPDDPTKIIEDGFDSITVSQNGNTITIDGRWFLTSGLVFIPVNLNFNAPTL